ncbi:MAG: type II secretion system secretin GspD [Pseudomonadota bacterium]
MTILANLVNAARALRFSAIAMMAAALALTGAPWPQGSAALAQEHTLNFRDAEIQAFIDDVSIVTGYSFIIDPDVRGRVTITSQSPLTEAEVFQVFLATLRVQGFAAVRTAPGVYQILPEAEGSRAGAPLGRAGEGDVFMTSVVRLESVSAREAIRTLGPMVSGAGAVNAAEGGNLVVMVDYASNVRAMEQVLARLDEDTSVVEIVTLENISADEMAGIIERMRSTTRSGEDDRRFAVSVAPVPASNSILLRGDEGEVARMITLVRRVDAVSRSSQTFRVVNLSHADGETVLPILQSFVEAVQPGETSRRGASIGFHAPTNAIIMNGEPDVLRELELVIGRLDVRQPQVLVEAIIVEISDSAARDLGVQFLVAGDGDDATPFATTRFGSGSVQPDLLALTGALTGFASNEDGTTSANDVNLQQLALSSLLGTRGGLIGVGGEDSNGNLYGLILNALETDTDSNVLSTPSVLTVDNEEASIIVGQQIPITTGEALGSNNTNPFRTIDRQDVGVKLEVRPQINEGDTIRLYIRQEVSSVIGPVSQDFSELITSNREIETTALADDGEIIVLGGLIERDDQYIEDAVPGLGRLPAVGRLFRNESRSQQRTNLMVFIRPTIVRSASDARTVTDRNFDFMVDEQRRATGDDSSSLEEIVEMMSAGGGR